MSSNDKKRVRVDLTEEQRKKVNETKEVPPTEFNAEELEDRIAPAQMI